MNKSVPNVLIIDVNLYILIVTFKYVLFDLVSETIRKLILRNFCLKSQSNILRKFKHVLLYYVYSQICTYHSKLTNGYQNWPISHNKNKNIYKSCRNKNFVISLKTYGRVNIEAYFWYSKINGTFCYKFLLRY